jgi:hypothetical protein
MSFDIVVLAEDKETATSLMQKHFSEEIEWQIGALSKFTKLIPQIKTKLDNIQAIEVFNIEELPDLIWADVLPWGGLDEKTCRTILDENHQIIEYKNRFVGSKITNVSFDAFGNLVLLLDNNILVNLVNYEISY